ncbi:hypothetical protein L3C95_16290 [Chitinophaga filiformis]|uniref:DUF6602 domain-containing protein n=1 Tax=Chitinophaga filiformis TaxID=104663 RepID=UPI001F261542|nr:DUF6602 domain-containing protein [Chitinophaga filiformis]MCF6404458.1 hypothetical protein [Chitinophaga filiformis]
MFNEFYRLKTEELLNQLLQVKTFIKKHNPTIGLLTEEILRRFLATFLPKGVSVEQGFVVGVDGELSKQIDVIIYDSLKHAPYYRINDIVVVPSSSVIAVIEIKTTVKSRTAFHEIISYFYSISKQLHCNTGTYLFIYNSATVEMLGSYFHSFKHPGNYQKFDHDTFLNLPDVITGINSSYHLKKDYVTFESDKMGYTSYNYIDNTDEDISSLELFYKDVYSRVSNYLAQTTGLSSANDFKFDIKSDRTMKSIFAIELFDM